MPAERLRTVVTQNARTVWRFLRRLGLSDADADDATQEVMLVVARKLDSIRDGSERSFALSTAFRVASSMKRLNGRRQEISDEALVEMSDPLPRPDAVAERKRDLELLDEILASMPLDLCAVLVAAEFEGLSLSEMADAFGIPRGTAASRLRAAREDFRARVARYEARTRPTRGAR